MLQIKKISKQYQTGDLIQNALSDVSLNFRDNEYVSILGPSGSGKTTLLNIIGGLDHYDKGDLIINNVSTKKYKDRDWDSYRNHTIGFVFQSYNLIPHQTVLANVELALTISGISKRARKRRALAALDKVGLKEQAHKKPNQMSGGQMQRVAIARALVAGIFGWLYIKQENDTIFNNYFDKWFSKDRKRKAKLKKGEQDATNKEDI